jgi:hypothetical protein
MDQMSRLRLCRLQADANVFSFYSPIHRDLEQYFPKRKAIDLSKKKNGSGRVVHLNADAVAAIESLRRPLVSVQLTRSSLATQTKASTTDRGSCPAWNKRGSPDIRGIATDTLLAVG